MKAYKVIVNYSLPYPNSIETIVRASNFSAATSKALRAFRKKISGKRLKTFQLRCDDLGRVDDEVKPRILSDVPMAELLTPTMDEPAIIESAKCDCIGGHILPSGLCSKCNRPFLP